MEGLNNLFQTAKVKGWIRGFQVGNNTRNNLEITHLQYADDTLVFCDAVEEQMLILRVIFNIFEAVSGLHINWSKSFIYPVNTVINIEDLANTLGGKVGELPTTYLGMPLGSKSKSKEIWSGVIEKCERKLANWKCQYLSSGGRLTLVNSVLDALPSYMMSLFPIPAKVTKRLDAIKRNFLWQGSEDKRKYHLVKWKELLVSKRGGGLNIRELKTQNKSLMMKWLWKFVSPEVSLWKEVIIEKYGMEDKWMTEVVTNPYNCSVWRSIRNLWQLVKERTSCKVGNGEKVAFWNDIWCGQEALKHAFPVLHSLSQGQEATVAELWTGQGWNLGLRRGLNDWEMTTIARFHDTMQMATNLTGEEDRLVWKGERGGEFTVKSAYRELRSTEEQHAGWPWRMIWKTEIPYKVNYFTWLLAKQAVLTHENLNKRKPNLRSSCYLCEEQVETVNHLFLHCKWTDQLWQMFIQKRKIKWTKPRSIIEVLQCWNRDGNAGKNEKRWRIVPACIWWTIWKERNQRCFEGKQNNIQKIKTNCLGLYYFWCKQVVIGDTENVFNIIDWL
ncbi:hypothetical protein MTR67_007833 [Solanum verrucosum]|uniref:Reverse transcriptase domain-containing protein n=1 Tax=Solanum verrucosum TaxID=315347 RepID=A0AAF0Q0Z2_SOLVR|nr:hypothetical protein MTR67_007833 [Solanum verrucosum]